MRSEALASQPVPPEAPPAPPPARSPDRWRWLRSQGLGLLCGQAAVLLLAVGSVVMSATRDGASAGIGLDDLTGFFEQPSLVHLWLYLLVPVFGLYALNTALATWHSLTRRWRAGIRRPGAYGPAVIHVAFLVALLAHGIGGLWSAERGVVQVGRDWSPLPDGRSARLLEVHTDRHPNGQPWQVTGILAVRDAEGTVTRETVAYNHPITADLSRELILMLRAQETVEAVTLSAGEAVCRLAPGEGCEVQGRMLRLLGVQDGGRMGPVVGVAVAAPGATPRTVGLLPGRVTRVGDLALGVQDVATGPALLLRGRRAAGNPWALASAGLLLLGVAMMARRFVFPGR